MYVVRNKNHDLLLHMSFIYSCSLQDSLKVRHMIKNKFAILQKLYQAINSLLQAVNSLIQAKNCLLSIRKRSFQACK